MTSFVSSSLLALGAILFILDLLLHGECDIRFLSQNNTKILVQLLLLGIYLFYLIINLKDTKKVALSALAFLPVLVMGRDLIEVRTYSFAFSLVDMVIVAASLVALFCTKNKELTGNIDRLSMILILFTFIGFIGIAVKGVTFGISYIYSAFVIPIIYLISLARMRISKESAVITAISLFLVSLSIFGLQNAYIGPLTVLQSSRDQTWLTEGVSIANGGFIELGAMQLILIPIAFYIIYNKIKVRSILGVITFKLAYIGSWFVLAMPFIYGNRSNAFVSIVLFLYFVYKKRTLKIILGFAPIFFPLMVAGLFFVVTGRSFVGGGVSINIFGIEISGINSTTYDHLYATISGFDALARNVIFGAGPFVGPGSWDESLYKIGNYRNYLLPVIEIAVTNGILFFAVYMLFVFEVSRRISDHLIKFYVLLSFLPVIGASKFFGLYATGSFNLSNGLVSLSDPPPVAIFSYGMVLLFLIGIVKLNEEKPNQSCYRNSPIVIKSQGG